jgi:MFS family permease
MAGHSSGRIADSQRKTLLLLCTAELFAMTPWFAGSTVVSQLQSAWHADRATAAWVTIAVQLGFVVGALLSATLNLPDVFSAPRIFVVASLMAALANALFAWVAADHMRTGIVLRFATGMLLAGIYPTGMKIMASWYRNGRGFALGALVGALTIGSALPHALYATGQLPWRGIIFSASVLTLIASAIVWAFVRVRSISASESSFQSFASWRNCSQPAFAPGKSGLPGPHVGAVLDVDLDCRDFRRSIGAIRQPSVA